MKKFKRRKRKKIFLLTKKQLEKIKLQMKRTPKKLLNKKFRRMIRTNLMKPLMKNLPRSQTRLKRRRNLPRKKNQKNQKIILAKKIIK